MYKRESGAGCGVIRTPRYKGEVRELIYYIDSNPKNIRNTPNRLEIKKYCPLSKKHELFKEIK